MKRIIKSIILGIILLPTCVYARSASISVPGTITNGDYFNINVNLNGVAAWNIKINASGATSGCGGAFADVTGNGLNTNKTLTIRCKANNVGQINVSISGDITDQNGGNAGVGGSKTITVVKPRDKEKESRLNSLSVEGYTLNPAFDKDKTVYSISIPPTADAIKINASAISKYATIKGTGQITIDGDTSLKIISTSETGEVKEYTINVSVIDENPIKIKIDNEDYTVIKNKKSLTKLEIYNETVVKIGDYDITAFVNETNKLTVIGVKDKDNNIKYAIKDGENYYLYNENKSSQLLIYITDKKLDGYKKEELIINEIKYNSYKIDDRFSIVYGMNLNTGEYNYYKYDKKDNTFQYFELEKKESKTNIFLITTIILSILLLITIILFILKTKKH